MRQRAARCGEIITVENGEIWCGEIDLTPVWMVGAEGKGPIRGPRTYAPISMGSAVRSADHGRQTPRRPRLSGLVECLSPTLNGGRRLLSGGAVRSMFFEVSPPNLEANKCSEARLLRVCVNSGFSCVKPCGGRRCGLMYDMKAFWIGSGQGQLPY